MTVEVAGLRILLRDVQASERRELLSAEPQQRKKQSNRHHNTRRGRESGRHGFPGHQRVERRTEGGEWPRSCLGIAWL